MNSRIRDGEAAGRGDSISRRLASASYTFRDSSHRFSGNFDCPVSLHRLRQMVIINCDKYEIPERNRVSILTDSLEGQALDFYLDHISGQVESLQIAFNLLADRFDSPHSRVQAQSYLESSTIASIRDEKQCSTAQALDVAVKRISNVAPMCGPQYQHESHKARWLANMLKQEEWAQITCANRMTLAQDYQTFIAALHASLTQMSISRGESITRKQSSSSSQMALTYQAFYGRRYARPPSFLSRGRKRSRHTPEQLRRLKDKTRCLRCGKKGHWRAECNENITMTDAINARMRTKGTNLTSIREALIALVQDEDDYAAYQSTISDQNNTPVDDDDSEDWKTLEIDPTPFETLIAQAQEEDDEYKSDDNKADCHFLTEVLDISHENPTRSVSFNINTVFAIIPNGLPTLSNPRKSTQPFLGGLIDTGAQKSVIGVKQALAYVRESPQRPQISKSKHVFRFGDSMLKAHESIKIEIQTPSSTLTVDTDIVEANIPFLIGLDAMRKHRVQPLIIVEELESVDHGWRLPLTAYRGHLYLRWYPTRALENNNGANQTFAMGTYANSASTRMDIQNILNPDETQDAHPPALEPTRTAPNKDSETPTRKIREFTAKELERIHKNFAHASARKLYDLLCRSSTQTPPNTLQQLEAIVKSYQTCAEFAPRSLSFRVREADSTLFNHKLTMDLVWLPARNPPHHRATRPALHIVDVGTRFNSATFINAEDSTSVWNAFLCAWSCLYIGMPSSLLVDQGSVFVSDEWRHACQLNQIELVPTGTGSHNSLHVGESYHAYLRRLYRKIQKDFPRIPDRVALAIATKAINDTTGPKGLCPTLLVFGILPQLLSPSKRDHPSQIDRFRAAASARREYETIVNAERVRLATQKKPPPAASTIYKPGDMVYVYRENANRYTGPHMIASFNGKQVRLHVGERTGPREFNIAQLRPSPLPNAHNENMTAPRYPIMIMHTEILRHGDPREALFDEEKRKELLGLLERGAFKICLREEAGPSPNIVPTRDVLAIEHAQRNQPPELKARFVIGGHRDRDKQMLLHDTRTVRAESIRLVLAMATIFGLKLSVADWRQGYVQSKSPLLRKIFVRPR